MNNMSIIAQAIRLACFIILCFVLNENGIPPLSKPYWAVLACVIGIVATEIV